MTKHGKKTIRRKSEAEVTSSIQFTITQSKYSIFLTLVHTDEVMEFENSPAGLQEAYQILTKGLGFDVDLDDREEEVLSFRKSSRPVLGVNHR